MVVLSPFCTTGIYKSQVVASWISQPLTASSILHKSYITPQEPNNYTLLNLEIRCLVEFTIYFLPCHIEPWCSFLSWIRWDQARGSGCSVSSRWLASKSNSSPEENLGEAKRENARFASWTKIQGWHWWQAWNRINVSMIVLRITCRNTPIEKKYYTMLASATPVSYFTGCWLLSQRFPN